jgi:hypothetical protein
MVTNRVTSHSVLRVSWYVALASKDIVPNFLKLLTLQRLHKKISDHVVGSAVLDLHISFLNRIGYKELMNV